MAAAIDHVEGGTRTAWALRLMAALCAHARQTSEPEALLSLSAPELEDALRTVLPQASGQMRTKGLRLLRCMLAARPRLAPVLALMPRFLRTEPNPHARQSQKVLEDCVPRRIREPWVRAMLIDILQHDKSAGWASSRTAHQTLCMIHHFLRCTGLLCHADQTAMLAHLHQLGAANIERTCRAFLDTLCRSMAAVRGYLHVFNLLFVDIWGLCPSRFRFTRRRRRLVTLHDIDSHITESTLRDGDGTLAPDYFDPTELQRLEAAAATSPRDNLVFQLLLTTGLRRTGLLNILVANVAQAAEDGGGRTVWCCRNATGQTLTKGQRHHVFLLHPPARAAIEAWLNTPEHEGGRPVSPSAHLLPSGHTDNGALSRTALSRIFKGICDRAGLGQDPRAHLHAMRHTHAHLLADAGNPVEVIARSLGHRSAATTTRVYLREGDRMAREKLVTPAAWGGTTTRGAVAPQQSGATTDVTREAVLDQRRQRNRRLLVVSNRHRAGGAPSESPARNSALRTSAAGPV